MLHMKITTFYDIKDEIISFRQLNDLIKSLVDQKEKNIPFYGIRKEIITSINIFIREDKKIHKVTKEDVEFGGLNEDILNGYFSHT